MAYNENNANKFQHIFSDAFKRVFLYRMCSNNVEYITEKQTKFARQ